MYACINIADDNKYIQPISIKLKSVDRSVMDGFRHAETFWLLLPLLHRERWIIIPRNFDLIFLIL